MLPRFLLADNSLDTPDTIFVVHTQTPRFIIETDIDDFNSNQFIHWIDKKPEDEDQIARLVEESEDFLEQEFENEEFLGDEEE
ncbi:MAG: hypothetical protein WCY58_12510 [Mariniphaga sp.]|nr:hypothetical protein [Mariniphaga sp.]MDD4226911.1 hypothetical protein [Mariniphaga sp.]MDD4425602.1 hypothetical protein [Mariniphaga sp.]